MIRDVVGPLISFALYVSGACIGWRMARVMDGEDSVPTQGFARGASKPLRVCAGALGAAAIGGGLAFLGWHLNSMWLVFMAVALAAVSIGVVHGAGMRGWLGFFRKPPF